MMGAVFKTVSEPVRACSGGFDSHTPPPNQLSIRSFELTHLWKLLDENLCELMGTPVSRSLQKIRVAAGYVFTIAFILLCRPTFKLLGIGVAVAVIAVVPESWFVDGSYVSVRP